MRLKRWWRDAFAGLLVAILLAGAPVASLAGPVTPSAGVVAILVFDESFQFLLQIEEPFFFDQPGSMHLDDLGPLEGSAIVSFDPDPLVSYELSLHNITGGAIQGALLLEIPIVPASGGETAHAQLDAAYLDTGGDGINQSVQHLPLLVENVGQFGRDTFLTALQLDAVATSEDPIVLAAGPSVIPGPGSGQYDRFAVQLTFALDAGDTLFFGGAASFPGSEGDCDDFLDNDGDGRVDFAGHDPGCSSGSDATERALDLPCDDGFDDDGDGWIDVVSDPGCAMAGGATESPACQDGLDNDGDGTFDFDGGASANGGIALGPADAYCSTPTRNSESPPRRCGLGFELALVLAVLAGRRSVPRR